MMADLYDRDDPVPRLSPAEHREALIRGLRELADWLDQHPDASVPAYPDFTNVGCTEVVVLAVAGMAGVEPATSQSGAHFGATIVFGPLCTKWVHIPDEPS